MWFYCKQTNGKSRNSEFDSCSVLVLDPVVRPPSSPSGQKVQKIQNPTQLNQSAARFRFGGAFFWLLELKGSSRSELEHIKVGL